MKMHFPNQLDTFPHTSIYYLLVPHVLNPVAVQLPTGLSKSHALLQTAFETAKVSICILPFPTCGWPPFKRIWHSRYLEVLTTNFYCKRPSSEWLSIWNVEEINQWDPCISLSSYFFLKGHHCGTMGNWTVPGICRAGLPSEGGEGKHWSAQSQNWTMQYWTGSPYTAFISIFPKQDFK